MSKDERIDEWKNKTGHRDPADYSDGSDIGLEPVTSLDLSKVETFSDLLAQMANTSFGGRQLGEAADVLHTMVTDPDCLVVGTFSGAMTVAKQGLVLADMIDHGMLDIVVSTGALMAHGLIEATGMRHYKVPTDMNDRTMFYAGFDRVYDTLELEKNLDDLEVIVRDVLGNWPKGKPASSASIVEAIGHYLLKNVPGRGVVPSAVTKGVPIYIPAFTDSELGLDVSCENRRRFKAGLPRIPFDPFLDVDEYADRVSKSKHIGIFTIGGGVPRNWAQQVAPYLDLLGQRADDVHEPKRFKYGVRICPEPVHWGGLSGCTYSEGVSWGKFVPPSDGGRFAEVPADATIAWPILIKAVLERLGS